VDAAEAPDADTTPEPSEAPEASSDTVPTPDDKLRKFADSQGIELDSPNAIKAAQLLQKQRSEATKNHRRTSELERTVTETASEYAEAEAVSTGQDPELLKTVRGMQVKEAVRDFWSQDGIDKAYEPQMIELLATKPHLAGDLDALYATAVMQSGKLDSVRSQGKREALESLAHKQTAAVPRGNATNSGVTPKEKPFKELSITEMESKLGFVRR
jgi:hypothetical protein